MLLLIRLALVGGNRQASGPARETGGGSENHNRAPVESSVMAEDNDEESEPAVELGDGEPVEGAPVARVASRLTWPIEKSSVVEKEGEAVVRTPDGPRELSTVLADIDVTYFERRQEFTDAVWTAVGEGPIPTADE